MKTVQYYRSTDGKCPVEEFLAKLSVKERTKMLWLFRLLERHERIPKDYFKKLTGTEIWECRMRTVSGAYRVFSFFLESDTLILTHGYSKKTWRTSPREIKKAEACRQEYLRRYGRK